MNLYFATNFTPRSVARNLNISMCEYSHNDVKEVLYRAFLKAYFLKFDTTAYTANRLIKLFNLPGCREVVRNPINSEQLIEGDVVILYESYRNENRYFLITFHRRERKNETDNYQTETRKTNPRD